MKGYVKIEKHQQLERDFAALQVNLEQVKFQLEQLKRMVFGAKSERFIPDKNPEQLSLFGVKDKKEQVTTEVPAHQRKVAKRKEKPARLVLPSHLEREKIVLEPDADIRDMVKIGEEKTETLVYTPAKLKVKQVIRPKYAPKTKSDRTKILIASLPSRFIDKCIADETLLTAILVDKFVDHLPLYRIKSRFERLGIKLPSSTIGGWVAQSAAKLELLYAKLVELVLKSNYLMVDETRMQVQTGTSPPRKYRKKPKKSKTHRGYLWGYLAVKEKLLFFDYSPSRKADNPAKHLKDFKGVCQTDAYEIYDQIRKAYPDLTHYHCLAHARREFEKAMGNDEKRAKYALEQFQLLYQIEAQAREGNWSTEQIGHARNEKARPILEKLFTWMEKESPKLPLKSPIGKAMGYMLKRKSRMLYYLTNGGLSIDTNALENRIRPIAVGRKNYLFCGSHGGARGAAIFYSFFACCKMNSVNPCNWLLDIMQRLPIHPINQLEQLLPHRWSALKN